MAYNQENKENKANITPKNQKKKIEAKEKTKNKRRLFSPNVTEIYKNFEESQLSDIHFSFNERNTIIKSSQTDSHNINNIELKKKEKEKKEENNKEKKEENNKEKKEENNKENKEENKKQQISIENVKE